MKIALKVLAVLSALELVARAFLFLNIPSEKRPQGLEAARMFFTGGSYVCEFRGQKHLFQKSRGTFRILALGGSTTAGIRGDEETWPFKLEALLNQPGKRYEVINLGQCGMSSPQEFFYLVSYGYLDPDLVVVYDGYNDLVHSNAQSAHYLLSAVKSYGLMEKKLSSQKIASFLYRHSALVNRLDVYLYRLKNFINEKILAGKWFGLGSQKKIRMFENIEWYASHLELNAEVEKLKVIDPATMEEKLRAAGLSEHEWQELKNGISGEKALSPDRFLRVIGGLSWAPEAKEKALDAAGFGTARVRIGGVEVLLDPLALAGLKPEKDLFAEIYRQSLQDMGAYLEKHRIPGVFVFQPFLAEKIQRLTGGLEAEDLKGMSNFTPEADRHFVSKNAGRKAIMRAAAEKYGLYFMDAQAVFDTYPNAEVYIDNCHNTDRGLQVLAGTIENFLREKVK